jgi:RNA polymerase sigma-70 factor (ECF subfamily)
VRTLDLPDEQLVAAAQGGDGAAMDLLLRRHYDRVHAVCRRIAGTTRDADDAAQEAMIRIVNSLDRFDGRSAFGTWAYRIATNTALDELRKRKRRPQLHLITDEDDRSGGSSEQADGLAHLEVKAISDRMAIDAALADVPEDFRIPVVMRDVGDLDYAEIAEELGVPIGTVKSRISRGRKILIERLGNRDDPPERPTQQHRNPESNDPAHPDTEPPKRPPNPDQ